MQQNSTMTAAIFRAPGQPLELTTVPRPVPGPGEVLIRTGGCGICGTDLHAVNNPDWPRDLVMGHEIAGTVAELGAGVAGPAPGTKVAAMPQITCGQCSHCLRGNSDACADVKYPGNDAGVHGGYAEYVIVGAQDVVPLPADADLTLAAVMQPMAFAWETVKSLPPKPQMRALIVGGGPAGLGIAQWCRFYGMTHVVVSERNPARLDVARAMGATATIDANTRPDTMTAYEDLTGTRPDVIFEVVGLPGMIQHCADMADPGTLLVAAGYCQEEDMIRPHRICEKRLRLIFPYYHGIDAYREMVPLMAQGRIDPSPMITHRIPLDELPAMVEAMQHPTDQIKTVVEFS